MSIGVTVELTVEDIAHTIKKLKKEDKEMLLLILSGKDKEISKRYRDIKSGRVKTLSREETFKDVKAVSRESIKTVSCKMKKPELREDFILRMRNVDCKESIIVEDFKKRYGLRKCINLHSKKASPK